MICQQGLDSPLLPRSIMSSTVTFSILTLDNFTEPAEGQEGGGFKALGRIPEASFDSPHDLSP